jgi:predicted aminopeptidase
MKRRKLMWFVGVIAALIVGYTGAFVASPEVRYLHRAGVEEGKILAARRPISDMANDTTVPAETRASLRLVLDARTFAARIGLQAKNTYIKYADVGRDTLLLVVTASGADCICPVTWKYPFVGRVPYKGFFDPREGRKFAAQLEARGYDVNLRPSAAYSTLGWFNDPLLSTALERDSMELAALVLHEIAHNTLWVKGNVSFNESYAQLVGYRGAEAFFRERGDTVNARRAADRWHDEGILGDFYGRLVSRADSFYAAQPDSATLLAGKIALAEWARGEFEGPVGSQLLSIHVTPTTIAASRPLNNARLVGITIYRSHLGQFEAWYQRHGGDLKASVAALDSAMAGVEGDSAWGRLQVIAP